MSATAHDVLVTRQLVGADRAARMDASGRDTDLGAEAELTAIRELRRRILQYDRRIDFAEEALGCRVIARDDALGVPRAVAANVLDSRIEELQKKPKSGSRSRRIKVTEKA